MQTRIHKDGTVIDMSEWENANVAVARYYQNGFLATAAFKRYYHTKSGFVITNAIWTLRCYTINYINLLIQTPCIIKDYD